MKWHLALLALLVGLTYCSEQIGTKFLQPSHLHLFFIDPEAHQSKQLEISVKNPRSLAEKYNTKHEYKNIYESYKTQASKGVYFKPIEEYFGPNYKVTTEPLTTSTAKPIEEKYTTSAAKLTTTPFYSSPSQSPSIYTKSKTLTSSTIKYPVPHYLKPQDATLKMDEPLFYSDYHDQTNLSSSSIYSSTVYPQRLETTTIKYENSVPIYRLSKPYYIKKTSIPPLTTKEEKKTKASTSHSKTDAFPLTRPFDNNNSNKSHFSSPLPYKENETTTRKAVEISYDHKTNPSASKTTKPSIKHKEAYEKITTTKSYIPSSYATSKTAKATLPIKAQKLRPFKYSYAVIDKPSYNDYSHQQESDGNVVTGSYRVRLPDGRVQIVTYRADKSGYNADVRYETPVDASSSKN